MSTTVTYKGDTLATVSNNTKTLKTTGKYMEGDVVLTDVSASANVWQDENGYVHLDDEGSSSMVGLEYEMGTWTPGADVASAVTIPFSKVHIVAPFYYMIADATNSYDSATATSYLVSYFNFHQLFGVPFWVNGDSSSATKQYGIVFKRYRDSATTLSQNISSLTTSYTDSQNDGQSNSRFWATESGITAYTNGYYWRTGHTYKWIAVWAPTT